MYVLTERCLKERLELEIQKKILEYAFQSDDRPSVYCMYSLLSFIVYIVS